MSQRRSHLRGAALAVLLLGCALAAGAASAAPLEVVVQNVRSMKGHVRVDVCREDQFLGDCAISGESPARPGDTTVFFPDVPAGAYAIQAYQDENDDHEVNRNRFGIPTEGFGFSHDASFSLGPPKFRHARFEVGDGAARLKVKLHYLPH